MNALLVISPNPEAVQGSETHAGGLDNGNDAGWRARLYVYKRAVHPGREASSHLQQAMSGRAAPSQASVAPGQTQSTLSAPLSPIPGQGPVTPGNLSNQSVGATQPIRPVVPVGGQRQSVAALARNAAVIADKDRNALLIAWRRCRNTVPLSLAQKADTSKNDCD